MPRNKKNSSAPTVPSGMTAPHQLSLLFTVVDRQKCDFYLDLLQSMEVNISLSLPAQGTACNDVLKALGIEDNRKSVILSVIRQDKAKEALELLDEKFKRVRNGKGIAFTVPFSSMIGVAAYRFFANKEK